MAGIRFSHARGPARATSRPVRGSARKGRFPGLDTPGVFSARDHELAEVSHGVTRTTPRHLEIRRLG